MSAETGPDRPGSVPATCAPAPPYATAAAVGRAAGRYVSADDLGASTDRGVVRTCTHIYIPLMYDAAASPAVTPAGTLLTQPTAAVRAPTSTLAPDMYIHTYINRS